jgi:hypothetical protein
MISTWKYMLFLALALPAIYVYAPPNLEDIAKSQWLDHISAVITKSLASAKPQAEVSPVDPVAAAKVDEDLDYRIAERTKSLEGWRAFLTAHPDGPHAQSARAELDKLAAPATSTAAAQAPDRAPPDTKIPSDVASPPHPSPAPEAATLASDEICRGDEDRLEKLSNNLTSDGVIRFLIELRCENLRPQLISLAARLKDPAPKAAAADPVLAERPDDKAPAAAGDAAHVLSASVSPESDVSPINPPLPPKRAAEPSNKARPDIVSHGLQPGRRASVSTEPSLPPILLALFGEHPKSSAKFHRTRAGGRFGPNDGAVGNGNH